MAYLIVQMVDGEVANQRDELMKEIFFFPVSEVPQQVGGDMTKFQAHPLATQDRLNQYSSSSFICKGQRKEEMV